jgi:hypothetical protein
MATDGPLGLGVTHTTTAAGTAGTDGNKATTGSTKTAAMTLASVNATRTAANTVTASITCGLSCTASASTSSLTMTGKNSVGATRGQITITNESLTMSGFLCGTTGTWNSTWTINTTAGNTDTTLAIEA